MEEAEITLIFMEDMEIPGANGIKCPKCGVEYLLEEFVIDQVVQAEKMLDGK
jgi:hypothetical protein